jgi:hypothetical protein
MARKPGNALEKLRSAVVKTGLELDRDRCAALDQPDSCRAQTHRDRRPVVKSGRKHRPGQRRRRRR